MIVFTSNEITCEIDEIYIPDIHLSTLPAPMAYLMGYIEGWIDRAIESPGDDEEYPNRRTLTESNSGTYLLIGTGTRWKTYAIAFNLTKPELGRAAIEGYIENGCK